MSSRDELREALCQYISETIICINTVRDFILNYHKWKEDRETESKEMIEIKNKNKNRICPKNKGETFVNKMKNTFSPGRAERLEVELEDELYMLVQQTLSGLEPLEKFLDALEKLALTSVHVFEPNQVLNMSDRDALSPVKEIIKDSKKISSLLLLFKRDNEAFFCPKLQNLDVLQHQLDMYIIIANLICNQFTDSPLCVENPEIDLNKDVSEDHIKKMLSHIIEIQELRMDGAFRMTFLFKGEHLNFMEEYSKRRPQMHEFLSEVEQCAKELDNMKTGKEISGVVSSSLGVSAGVVSIVGLALIPVTAGVSSILIGVGAGIAAASGGTSIATLVADKTVNSKQMGKANNALDMFKDNMNALQRHLNNIIHNSFIGGGEETTVAGDARIGATAVSIMRSIDTVIDLASAGTEMGQAAAEGAMAFSRVARGGFIAANVLFIGFDVTMLVQNSVELYKGKESENSKLIRARAALWRSEIDSWEKICESLEQSKQDSEKKTKILENDFY